MKRNVAQANLLLWTILYFAVRIVVFGLIMAGITALWNESSGGRRPVWDAAILGAALGALTECLSYAERKDWITLRFWPDRSHLKCRLAELATEREQLLRSAKKH